MKRPKIRFLVLALVLCLAFAGCRNEEAGYHYKDYGEATQCATYTCALGQTEAETMVISLRWRQGSPYVAQVDSAYTILDTNLAYGSLVAEDEKGLQKLENAGYSHRFTVTEQQGKRTVQCSFDKLDQGDGAYTQLAADYVGLPVKEGMIRLEDAVQVLLASGFQRQK